MFNANEKAFATANTPQSYPFLYLGQLLVTHAKLFADGLTTMYQERWENARGKNCAKFQF